MGERAIRNRHAGAEADHAELILRVAGVVLLEVVLADMRAGGHEDPGACAAAAGVPTSGPADDATRRVQLGGVLAEVPDGAVGVLRVVVPRALGEVAVLPGAVVDDPAAHAVDELGRARRAKPLEHP